MVNSPQQLQFNPKRHYNGGPMSQRGPSAAKIIAVLGGLPVGGTLLALAGLTLIGSVVGVAITTPLFIICSPVLVPAAFVMGLAIAGFLSSGALGLTGLASLSQVFNYLRQARRSLPQEMDQGKRHMQGMAAYVGQKPKDVGQDIQRKAQEGRRA